MKSKYLLLSLAFSTLLSPTHSMDKINEGRINLEVYERVNAIKNAFLTHSTSAQDCHSLLDQVDFSDDKIPEIDQDRVEAGVLYINLGDSDKGLQLFDYNIKSRRIPFDYKVFSLVIPAFSDTADINWVLQRLPNLTVNLSRHYDDIGSALALATLNSVFGKPILAERIWNASVKLLTPNDASEMWEAYSKKAISLGIKLQETNPFTSPTFSAFAPFWKEYLTAHSKRNVAKMSRQRIVRSKL